MLDAHCHLDAVTDRRAVVARARAAGVDGWLIAGTQPATWDRTEAVAAETGGWASLGVHPWCVSDLAQEPTLDKLRARRPRILGELGLDAVRTEAASMDQQEAWFRAQLALARELDVPVVLHCVRAGQRLLDVVAADGLPSAGGMLHGWGGPADQAARAVKLGLHVSFGPLVCRGRAKRARASVVAVPVERLLVETDAPDQPLPGRTVGEPADVVRVLATVAHLRGAHPEALAAQTDRNLRALLGAA